jgi:hypothetical protein
MFLRTQWVSCVLASLAFSLVGGCAPDLGTPDYSSQVGLREPIDPFPPVPPDPFQPGDQRLSVGYFYEGGRSVTILINTVSTDYFVFAIDVDDPVATRSFGEGTSTDRVEGLLSYEITLNGSSFWAGGIVWFEPIDLSNWTTMFVSFKSSDPSFANFDLTLQSGEGEEPTGVVLDPTAYGYTNDGEWHFLEIPLQDAIDLGWDPSTARSPFIFGAGGGDAGDVLLIDNLYFTTD